MMTVELFGHRYRVLVHPDASQGRLAQFEMWAGPDCRDVPRINHRHDLSVVVLDGRFDLWCDGEVVTYDAGSAFVVPRGAWATFNNPDDAPARALLTVSPAAWAVHVLGVGTPVADTHVPIAENAGDDFLRLHSRDRELDVEVRIPGVQPRWLSAIV